MGSIAWVNARTRRPSCPPPVRKSAPPRAPPPPHRVLDDERKATCLRQRAPHSAKETLLRSRQDYRPTISTKDFAADDVLSAGAT
jgi:hypothetical protein